MSCLSCGRGWAGFGREVQEEEGWGEVGHAQTINVHIYNLKICYVHDIYITGHINISKSGSALTKLFALMIQIQMSKYLKIKIKIFN